MALALVFGLVTALANLLGGYLAVINRVPSRRLTALSLAFGGGFLLGAALLEMLPESFQMGGPSAPLLALLGYGVVYAAEHLFAGHAHELPGEHHVPLPIEGDPPADHALAREFQHGALPITAHASLAALVGFNVHDFIDGLAIGAGMVTSQALGVLMFLAVLFHEVPAGFVIASIMRGAGRSRRVAVMAGLSLGLVTIPGILIPFWGGGVSEAMAGAFLALSAGTFIYIATTDLIPAVAAQRLPGSFLAVFGGAALFYLSARLLEGLSG